jgi:hypothetical protein
MENSESLENTKGRSEKEKEVYASLYLDALRRQLDEYHTGECDNFGEMDEEILEEIDQAIEPHLEDIQPDLVIKRVKGLQFLIFNRERYEKKLRDTNI